MLARPMLCLYGTASVPHRFAAERETNVAARAYWQGQIRLALVLIPVEIYPAVSPRPFLVTIMMAASAAFTAPFGYQTNVLVYQMGGYRYTDFVRSRWIKEPV